MTRFLRWRLRVPRFGLRLGLTCAALLLSAAAAAEVVTETVDYEHDGVTLSAFVASDAAVSGERPGVLICHAWMGQDDYSRERARQLAAMGYTAVVLDMYGKGKLAEDAEQAGAWAGAFYRDRQAMRDRAAAGLAVLKAQPNVDGERVVVIGYCFGGTTALELGYAGADVAGIVSFHGSLMPPRPDTDDAGNVEAGVLICHGQADPMYGMDKLVEVIDALQAAEVDVTTAIYSGAVHSFTDPGATGEMEGAKYDAAADARSWEHFEVFLDEVVAGGL